MTWIKRNLFFVISEFVALLLLGAGGYVLYTQYSEEGAAAVEILSLFEKLDGLNKQNPHPGDGKKLDNVKNAKDQAATVKAFLAKAQGSFERVHPIPDLPKVSNEDFAGALRNTVQQLGRSATNLSVQILQGDYFYSFEAQRKLVVYEAGSPDRLALQLGEVKAICDVLFDAKINSLDSIRRETVTSNDVIAADLLYSPRSISNNLAVLAPYEVVIRCFSAELGQVLGKLASSRNGLIVSSMGVQPAEEIPQDMSAPGVMNPPPNIRRQFDVNTPGASVLPGGGLRPMRPGQTPTAAPVASRTQNVVLDEKPLRVTLIIYVVRLKPTPSR